ncbi:MAG: hypothetical protein PWP44_1292 [Thermacetogenium sp.]|nr:hypothetical protein [Thermacetogenium sp.]
MGDPFGLEITHEMAAGMGGMRTAGDLVARLQLSKAMKIDEAKKYVADKLGISTADLSDESVMAEVRESLNIGRLQPPDGAALGIQAKFRIAKLLGLKINSVELFLDRAGIA